MEYQATYGTDQIAATSCPLHYPRRKNGLAASYFLPTHGKRSNSPPIAISMMASSIIPWRQACKWCFSQPPDLFVPPHKTHAAALGVLKTFSWALAQRRCQS